MHRQGDRAVPASAGRYLAEHIPGAEYAELRVSPHTVDGRLRRVFAKLGVNTRVELTAEYARVTG